MVSRPSSAAHSRSRHITVAFVLLTIATWLVFVGTTIILSGLPPGPLLFFFYPVALVIVYRRIRARRFESARKWTLALAVFALAATAGYFWSSFATQTIQGGEPGFLDVLDAGSALSTFSLNATLVMIVLAFALSLVPVSLRPDHGIEAESTDTGATS